MAFLSSCKDIDTTTTPVSILKDNSTIPSTSRARIAEKSTDEQYGYKRNHFEKIATSVLLVQNNKAFKKNLYAGIESKFDGDYNVLIETVLTSIKSNISSKDNLIFENSKSSNEAFKGIVDKDFFPQIFIPYYSELKKAGKIGISNPKIVLYVGDEGNTVNPYKLDSKNNLSQDKTISIDESYAKKNEVWVISLNERVHDRKGIESANSASKARGIAAVYYPKIKTVNIKVDYEDWLGGDSDIAGKGYFQNSTMSISPGSGFAIWFTGTNSNGCKFLTYVSDSQLNTVQTCTNPNTYTNPWDPTSYGDQMYYAIFEEDSFPTGYKDAEVKSDDPAKSLFITFRSKDPEYWKGRISLAQLATFSASNSFIAFTTSN